MSTYRSRMKDSSALGHRGASGPRRERRDDELLTESLGAGSVAQELQNPISDSARKLVGMVEHEGAVVVARDVSQLEDHARRVWRHRVLISAPVKEEVPTHVIGDMRRVVLHPCRIAVRLLDRGEQRIFIRSAAGAVRHLESAPFPDAVTIRA